MIRKQTIERAVAIDSPRVDHSRARVRLVEIAAVLGATDEAVEKLATDRNYPLGADWRGAASMDAEDAARFVAEVRSEWENHSDAFAEFNRRREESGRAARQRLRDQQTAEADKIRQARLREIEMEQVAQERRAKQLQEASATMTVEDFELFQRDPEAYERLQAERVAAEVERKRDEARQHGWLR